MGSKVANFLGVKWFSFKVFWFVILHPILITSTLLDLQMENDTQRKKLLSWMTGEDA